MKRPLTLTGGILGLIAHVVYTGFMLFVLLLIFDLIASLGGSADNVGVIIGCVAISAICITLNILTLITWNKSFEKYRKRLAINIITVVLNVAFAILLLIGSLSVFTAIIAGVEIIASIMILIDIFTESKKKKAINELGAGNNESPAINTQNREIN